MQHIAKVGIELEGRWHVKKDSHKPDGSVHLGCLQSCPPEAHTYGYTGEIASRPLLIKSMEKWMTENYPEHVDKSCGLHVHFSLTKMGDYARLTHEDFWEYYTHSWVKWGKDHKIQSTAFWDRLRGDNRFCEAKFDPHTQHLPTNKDQCGNRYRQLNYCYGLHKTIECRMLPMFKRKDIAIKAVWHLISLVNVFLDQAPEVKWDYREPIPPDNETLVTDTDEVLDYLSREEVSFRDGLDFSPYVPSRGEHTDEDEPEAAPRRYTARVQPATIANPFRTFGLHPNAGVSGPLLDDDAYPSLDGDDRF